jgi:hypothetical protein
MGYLTSNTRSNRVVIISSVITRIFKLCSIPGRSHFILFNKDTRDLFMLCIMCLWQLVIFVIYYCCSLFIVIIHLFCSLFDSHSFFVQLFCFIVHCSKEKIRSLTLGCIPGILIPFNHCTCCTRIPSPSKQFNKTSYIRLHRLCLSIRASGLLRS